MKYFLSLQSFGDNLISLYLLSQIDAKVKILGTKHTQNIARLMEVEDKFDLEVIFDDIPAFYDVRKQGMINAIKDMFKFRQYIKEHNIKELIFEKKDIRTKMLTFGLSKYLATNLTKPVYINRKNLIEESYSSTIQLKSSIKPNKETHTILISPSSRIQEKNIRKNDFDIIISILKEFNFTIQLVDYTGDYIEYKDKVNEYYPNTTLDDVKELIVKSDFFIGADSFLVHLAYFYDKAFFIVFNLENFDFLPPNADVIDNYIITNRQSNIEKELKNKFIKLGVVGD